MVAVCSSRPCGCPIHIFIITGRDRYMDFLKNRQFYFSTTFTKNEPSHTPNEGEDATTRLSFGLSAHHLFN